MLKAVNLTGGKPQRSALLAYLEDPVRRAQAGEELYPFSNLGLAVELVRALNRSDFVVDVVNWDAKKLPKSRQYDLFIGHGGLTFDALRRQNTISRTIYFASGSAAQFHNSEAAKRSKAFYGRRGVKYAPDRPVEATEQKIYAKADAVICLGNSDIAKTFPSTKEIYNINIAVSRKTPILWESFGRDPRHLLFFSGGGNLHKGLDLAIESVIGTELTLHVCTSIDPRFRKIYEQQYSAEELHNIQWHGYVAQNSRLFRRLVRKCQFAILLSCSEGSPGSLIDAMQYGLIPIVTRACGIDVSEAGILIEDLDIASIRNKLLEASYNPSESIARQSQKVKRMVTDEFSLERFIHELDKAIGKASA